MYILINIYVDREREKERKIRNWCLWLLVGWEIEWLKDRDRKQT